MSVLVSLYFWLFWVVFFFFFQVVLWFFLTPTYVKLLHSYLHSLFSSRSLLQIGMFTGKLVLVDKDWPFMDFDQEVSSLVWETMDKHGFTLECQNLNLLQVVLSISYLLLILLFLWFCCCCCEFVLQSWLVLTWG